MIDLKRVMMEGGAESAGRSIYSDDGQSYIV